MPIEYTPAVEATSAYISLEAPEQQVATASPLPDLWAYDIQTNTVTGVYHQRPSPELEKAFNELSQQWRAETAYMSLASERANSFLYHQIMGMGKEVLPLIFKELSETTSDWFWALRAITRTDDVTVPEEEKGNVHRVAQAWLDWGRRNGYVRD